MVRRNEKPTFKRRRFTIPESLDAVLEELANQNYQGNVSLCIRAAIEDHKQTLDGVDPGLQKQQLALRIDELGTQQERVLDSLNMIEKNLDQSEGQSRLTDRLPQGVPENAPRIIEAIESADDGLRIDDVADRLELQTSKIQPVIGALLDYGLLTARGKPPSRYQLAGETNERRS